MAQQRTCAYYLKNACTRGATCPYAHTDRKTTKFAPAPTQSAKPCLHFQRGTCKFGSKCPLRHSTPHSVRPDGVAERVSVKASDDDDAFCVFFAAGQCARGDACNFSHSVRYGPSSGVFTVIGPPSAANEPAAEASPTQITRLQVLGPRSL